LKVGEAAKAYTGPRAETMRKALGKKLGLGRAKVIDYLGRYRRAHRP